VKLTKKNLLQLIREEIYETERIEVPAESPLSDEQETIVSRFEDLHDGWQPMSAEGGQYMQELSDLIEQLRGGTVEY